MSKKEIDELLKDDSVDIFDGFWVLSMILLLLFNSKDDKTTINFYIKEGD